MAVKPPHDIGSYRGTAIERSMPVRGQRTKRSPHPQGARARASGSRRRHVAASTAGPAGTPKSKEPHAWRRSGREGRGSKASRHAQKKGGAQKRESQGVRVGSPRPGGRSTTRCHPHGQVGKVVSWASAGSVGFKGSRKSTPSPPMTRPRKPRRKAMDLGLKQVESVRAGVRGGPEAAIRSLQAVGLEISAIRRRDAVPHNGCRDQAGRV